MKAIRVHETGGPEVLTLEDVADLTPGADQVVVKIHAIGVNPVETYIRAGKYPVKASLPYTPGTDAAGIVESVGGKVRDWKAGARVYLSGSISGTYAEQALCSQDQLHKLPERLSFAQGAAINVPYATAYRALFQRAKAVAGEMVLVHGASGGVGTAAVQLAVAQGLTVAGTAGSDKGIQLVEEQGAKYVLNHHDSDYISDLLGATCGLGFDVILEMLANINLGKDLTLLAPGGRVAVVGSRGKVEIDPRDAMSREAAIFGVQLTGATPKESQGIHAALGAGFANGTLTPIVGEEIPLAEAPRAHEAVIDSKSYGKIVLVP